jgi:hypothetical protein
MSCESRVNDKLKYLGYKIEIRYWSIASQVRNEARNIF